MFAKSYKLLLRNVYIKAQNIARYNSKNTSSVNPIKFEQLTNRSLLKITGSDTDSYLQGLITNDIQHLNKPLASMYTMFLNSKGRVLADSIIYRTTEENTYYLEFDSLLKSTLESHLKKYILRKKIEISNFDSALQIWVIFDTESDVRTDTHSKILDILNTTKSLQESYENICFIYKDPRSLKLGLRIITPKDTEKTVLQQKFQLTEDSKNTCSYKCLRYKLGVGEGSFELPPEKCFPLEANGDYLHGVSFHKGCYLGQEFTARTHHTGVIRKRLMPLILQDEENNQNLSPESLSEQILASHDKSIVGKLRGIEQNFGLGLLRVDNALKHNDLLIGNIRAKTRKPTWWPVEAPKNIKIKV